MRLPVLTEEFPPGAGQLEAPDRREFLKLLGGTLALAGCTRAPPASGPSGPAEQRATCVSLAGVATALSVTLRGGKPTKVEGHPDHPLVRGGAGPLELSELLRLYDPQRASRYLRERQPTTRKAFVDAAVALVRAASAKDGGRAVRFLSEPTSSPLLIALKTRLLELLPNARFVTWSPLSAQSRYDGAKLAFGRPFEPLYDFTRARVVAAFDDDFLFPSGPGLGHARAWAARRAPGPKMSRLYAVEPSLTVTGASADHRLAVKGSEVESTMRALVAAMAQQRPSLKPLAANAPPLDPARQKWVTALARDLAAAGPEALVTVGDRQPPVVHALAHALSEALGSIGNTVTLIAPALAEANSGPGPLKALGDELAVGPVDALIITAPNPAYSAYGNVDLKGLFERTKAVIYLGLYEDETAAAAQWFVPRLHPFETWGDSRAVDGSLLFQQPLLEPLQPLAMSEAQLYLALLGQAEKPPLDLMSEAGRKPLASGAQPNSAFPAETVAIDLNAIAQAPVSKALAGVELCFARDYKVHDGRFASCAWLQELPDPITKLVWDNAALMSRATATKLGIAKDGERVKLSVNGRGLAASLLAPVLVLDGHADDSITLPLGYGRTGSGEPLAQGVGVSAYALRHSDTPYFSPVEVAKADGTHPLVTTRAHWSLEAPEAIAPELAAPGGAPRWGMAIDLNRCTGCSACITACQAENNLPVVGKDGVANQREMFWIRVERFPEGPAPVTCQHCEQAPCETVCPTAATAHDAHGLNAMIYGRCVGTRHCGNNCPYRVRRFNYLAWEPRALNPAVAVRERGVMEKCTFCVHRIDAGPAAAVRTACQQACPTGAIAFGRLDDLSTEVAQWHADGRAAMLLAELGTRPRTVYLARVTNPNPELA